MTSRKIDRLEIRKDEGQRRNCNLVNNESRENHASLIKVAAVTFFSMIEPRDRRSRARKTRQRVARRAEEKIYENSDRIFTVSFGCLTKKFLKHFYFCNPRYSYSCF